MGKKTAPSPVAVEAPASAVPAPRNVYEYAGKVVKVIDGDTVAVDILKDVGFGITITIPKTLRLKGINAPETSGPTAKEGLASKGLLATLLPPGQAVLLRTDKPDPKDKYGRFLAEIWLDGLNLNEHMVVAGAAAEYAGGKR